MPFIIANTKASIAYLEGLICTPTVDLNEPNL